MLKANQTLPAIVVTHAYLYNGGARYDVNKVPAQSFDPDTYNDTARRDERLRVTVEVDLLPA